MAGDDGRGLGAGSALDKILEKDMGSADRLAGAGVDFGGGDDAVSGLLSGGSADVPFVEALMADGAACLGVGDVG